MNKTILSIDPGGTTGLAYKGISALAEDGGYRTGTAKTPEEVAQFIVLYEWDIILIEQFSASVVSKHGLYTVRLVGWVEALCWQRNTTLIHRTPQQRRAFQDAAHIYVHSQGPGHVVHESDALAHLMAYEASLAMGQSPL